MTNTEMLRSKISDAGIKMSFIAVKLGISKQALAGRFARNTGFTARDMIILKDLLHLTDDEAKEIFLA